MTSAYILLLSWLPAQEPALTYYDERAREALTAAIADMQPRDHLQELRDLRKGSESSQPTSPSMTAPVSSVSSSPGADQQSHQGHSSTKSNDTKETYVEAKERSIREGKPFVVWVGEGVCPSCIQSNRDEFVHWVDPDGNFDGLRHGLVVGMPEAGKSIKIAEITDWSSGHIPTVRRAIRRWDESRTTTFHARDSWRGTDGMRSAVRVDSPRITGPAPFRITAPPPTARPAVRFVPMSFRGGRSSRGCST